ncbi:head-tail connector protein [Cognatishimia sp. SS12]|uniref:head-tail connector protein n=1 Tax=Cognatishimia sp. SS12 TaxID=2979465 RepID=UPI00232C0CEF|nr:head-tail connector protein [Cognatishimia sp. SS12]MDC0737533.1 head-tail connector protein [Cognatishimia sp. SS12]
MMLVDETTVPLAALPLAEFRAHLRMGTGFGEETLQDGVLESFLRASIAAIEARTSKVLIARGITWRVTCWQSATGQSLPLAPVISLDEQRLLDAEGGISDITALRLVPDTHRPMLRPIGAAMPVIAKGGQAEIVATIGLSATWDGLPVDLRQAVLMLAAHFYEYRQEVTLGAGCMPFGVTSLLARYVPLRLGFAQEQGA